MPGAPADRAGLEHIVAAVRALDSHSLVGRSVEQADMYTQLEAAAAAHNHLEAVAAVAMYRWAVRSYWGTLEVSV
jgi:hypothetical protein